MRLGQSPFDTRQEMYRDNPFQMLMVCMMLNQTNYKQVDKVRDAFFEAYPTPEAVLIAKEEDIAELIRPLGFYNKRAKAWKTFCTGWIALRSCYDNDRDIEWQKLAQLHGIGKYATDSWRVFQNYEYDIEVEDHVLVKYVEWAREEKERLLREASPWQPTTVYYLHYNDDRFAIPAWQKRQDYAITIAARTMKEAADKAKKRAGGKHIRILGIVPGKWEHVDKEDAVLQS